MPNSNKFHFAIDGNEANVKNRVGSNVYAFRVISELAKLAEIENDFHATVLLSQPPVGDLPNSSTNWQYRIIKPKKLWTQIAAPWHLYTHQFDYDVYFTPGHYAPRFCSIPYVSSVMDLAYLHFPNQFQKKDLAQLTAWTKYSVKHAKKIIAISKFTKSEIISHYKKNADDIIVAYPGVSFPERKACKAELIKYLINNQIRQPYFLTIGTLQPRKNLINLIKAYELFYQNSKFSEKPQLVVAGKIGWLAEPILEAAKNSSVSEHIIFTDFVDEYYKPNLYKEALATIMVGLYEGFGIPVLESLHYNTVPIASNGSGLPEVVGDAGLLVNPHQPEAIANALEKAVLLSKKDISTLKDKMQAQRTRFSWEEAGHTILQVLYEVAETSHKTNKRFF